MKNRASNKMPENLQCKISRRVHAAYFEKTGKKSAVYQEQFTPADDQYWPNLCHLK